MPRIGIQTGLKRAVLAGICPTADPGKNSAQGGASRHASRALGMLEEASGFRLRQNSPLDRNSARRESWNMPSARSGTGLGDPGQNSSQGLPETGSTDPKSERAEPALPANHKNDVRRCRWPVPETGGRVPRQGEFSQKGKTRGKWPIGPESGPGATDSATAPVRHRGTGRRLSANPAGGQA